MAKKSYEKLRRVRKTQTQGKRSKLAQQLKINTPSPKINSPNTLNAISPP
jgi:hypothetical protein